MRLFRVGGLLLVALSAVWSASIPFGCECSKETGFLPDPNVHKPVGYITDFNGPGLTLQKDFQVYLLFKPTYPQIVAQAVNGALFKANVVGVIEKFTWAGGLSDPISIEFYGSKENATLLWALTNSALKTTSVQSIGWWIGDYDQETKGWYEAAKPLSSPTLKAMIQGSSVSFVGTPAAAAIDVLVYKVSIQIVPQAHQVSTLSFANSSSKKPVIRAWGLP